MKKKSELGLESFESGLRIGGHLKLRGRDPYALSWASIASHWSRKQAPGVERVLFFPLGPKHVSVNLLVTP